MARRPGITLLEVLIAIFIMAIGMLAIMTLFPLGAFSMAQAIQDERVYEANQQATSIADTLDLRNNANVTGPLGTGLTTDWDGPSHPVFVDALGVAVVAAPTYVDPGNNGVKRVAPTFATARPLAFRVCSLLDDITFDANGLPANYTASLDREPRFTWCYLLKRPNNRITDVVEMSVVVYAGRGLFSQSGEALYNVTAAGDSVAINYGGGIKPEVRPGSWILDVTKHPLTTERAAALKYGPCHGFFYRVTGVNDVGNSVTLQLQPTPPTDSDPTIDSQIKIKKIVVMDGVVDVAQKGTGRLP